MYLEAQKSWEIDNQLLAALGDTETRQFPLIEISVNTEVFHVELDIEYNDEEETYPLMHRFFCLTHDQALTLIKSERVVSHKISLMTPRFMSQNKKYAIQDVEEILLVESADKRRAILYRFCDGTESTSCMSDEISEYEVKKCFYSRNMHESKID